MAILDQMAEIWLAKDAEKMLKSGKNS